MGHPEWPGGGPQNGLCGDPLDKANVSVLRHNGLGKGLIWGARPGLLGGHPGGPGGGLYDGPVGTTLTRLMCLFYDITALAVYMDQDHKMVILGVLSDPVKWTSQAPPDPGVVGV